jgi:hypothetical protein
MADLKAGPIRCEGAVMLYVAEDRVRSPGSKGGAL